MPLPGLLRLISGTARLSAGPRRVGPGIPQKARLIGRKIDGVLIIELLEENRRQVDASAENDEFLKMGMGCWTILSDDGEYLVYGSRR